MGYEGYYKISDLGRVKSVTREVRVIRNGIPVTHVRKGIYKKIRTDRLGYLRVGLNKDGYKKRALVHRLVAEAFIPNPDGKKYVNHLNSKRDDPRKANLAWCTHAENMKHATEYGLVLKGGDNPNSKLIVNCRGEKFGSIAEAAEAYNLKSMTSISNNLSGYKKSAGKYPDGTRVKWSIVNE